MELNLACMVSFAIVHCIFDIKHVIRSVSATEWHNFQSYKFLCFLLSAIVLLAQQLFPIVCSSLLVSCLNVALLIRNLVVVWFRSDSLMALVRYQCECPLLVSSSPVWLLFDVVPWLHSLLILPVSLIFWQYPLVSHWNVVCWIWCPTYLQFYVHHPKSIDGIWCQY